MTRFFDDNTVYRDPATFDILFGFATRAGNRVSDAFNESNGIGHDQAIWKKRRIVGLPEIDCKVFARSECDK